MSGILGILLPGIWEPAIFIQDSLSPLVDEAAGITYSGVLVNESVNKTTSY